MNRSWKAYRDMKIKNMIEVLALIGGISKREAFCIIQRTKSYRELRNMNYAELYDSSSKNLYSMKEEIEEMTCGKITITQADIRRAIEIISKKSVRLRKGEKIRKPNLAAALPNSLKMRG